MSRILIALSLLLMWGSSAGAQTAPWQREERTTAGWTFTPGTSAGGFWDTGLQFGADSGSDTLFTGTANPWAELDYNGRHSHVNFGYSGALEKYWAQGLRWEQRGKMSARRVVNPRFDVFGDASYADVPTTDRLQLTDGVVPFVTVDSRWLSTGGGVSWKAGPRTRVFGNYRFEKITLDDAENAAVFPVHQLRDGYSHAPSIGFTRQFTSRLDVGATGEWRREHVGDFGGDYNIKTLTAEFTYRWSPVMSISGGGGLSQLETLDFDARSNSPTYHAGFDRRLRTLTMNAHYNHGIDQLYGFGTLASNNTFSGGAFVPFADRLYYLNLDLSYTRSQPVTDLGVGLDLRTLWTNAAVGRQLTPWLRGEGFIGLAHQGAPNADSTDRLRIGVQLSTSKPLRIQ